MEYCRIRIDKIDLFLPIVIRDECSVDAIQLQKNLEIKIMVTQDSNLKDGADQVN